MGELHQKYITVGISGGIAAFRSLELIRLLRRQGATVKTIPTPNALNFVTQLTLDTLSGSAHIEGIEHVENAYRTDLMIIAPATANTLAKMAHGLADNLLLQTWLSFRGPVIVVPSMETHMWENPATQANIATLISRGINVVGPEYGELASGRSGIGRMASQDAIFESILTSLSEQDYAELKTIVTAGPTVESIDPVRFLSNHSSGKMGVALARALAHRGATVELVHGPLSVAIPSHPNIMPHAVQTALQMHDKTLTLAPQSDLAILCAAVADYRVEQIATQKIKKSASTLSLNLVRNPDILGDLGSLSSRPFLVGFAAETSELESRALAKCRDKNCDIICANLIEDKENPFGSEENELTLLDKSGSIQHVDRTNKYRTAHQILDIVRKHIQN